MPSVFHHRVPSSRRRTVRGIGISLGLCAAILTSASGMAQAFDGDARTATPSAIIAVETADEALFPLGKPPALIEATGTEREAVLWLDNAPFSGMDPISTGAILTTRSLAGLSAFALPSRIMPADRHIVIGLMLLALSGMATTSFGLWRWQLRGLKEA